MRSRLMPRVRIQDKTAVAIGAVDEPFVAHFEIDLRMPEHAPAAIAGDAGVVHDDGFGLFDSHGVPIAKRRADHSRERAGCNRGVAAGKSERKRISAGSGAGAATRGPALWKAR